MSNAKGSDRHINAPVQAILQSLQKQRLRNFATNLPRSDELLAHPQNVPQGGVNTEIFQWIEYTVIQAPTSKYKEGPCQKGGKQGRSPVASTSKPQANQTPQEGKKNKKRNLRKPYSPFTGYKESKRIPCTIPSTWPEPRLDSKTKRVKEGENHISQRNNFVS
ncbi:hypothetical protein O181_077717 [Austropuccinia psidii MF-1]|uniref:Uncharacterized protein n=1 Tax=Austropuccinia psidii MF-1 TaxID=1389203 RepID=A0A9Q3IEY3_9BASI|nr:hypothetical protein [Austropuccinia psidii MF-1]